MKNWQNKIVGVLAVSMLAGCPPSAYEVDGDSSTGYDGWNQHYDLNGSFREAGGDGRDGANSNDMGIQPDTVPTPDMCVIPPTCNTTFTLTDSGYKSCELMGNTSPLSWTVGGSAAMSLASGVWSVTVALTQATTYQYKFRCTTSSGSDTWIYDQSNPNKVDDGMGSYNSVKTASCNPCGDGGIASPDGSATGDGGTTPASFDWRDGVMYFVMLDRFANGDTKNDKTEASVKNMANWHGGDLAGLLAKLQAGYFTGLGVNVLWVSCPIDAPDGKYIGNDAEYYAGYHGYWPTELTQVETRLGTLALLKQVVAEAHKQKIKVIMDYVMNHVHINSSVYKSNSSWFWPLYKGTDKCVCGTSACGWDGADGERCWFMDYLPDFDFTNASARAYSVGNAVKWLKDADLDGFRLDAVKHINMTWLTDLRTQVKAAKPGVKFYMVGETYTGDVGTIKKYINPATMLDGQFDFPMRAALVKYVLLRQGSFSDLDTFLNGNDNAYPAGTIMGTFIGNHDLPRVIHYAEDSPGFTSEWDSGKSKAWYNLPSQPSGTSAYERLAVGFTALFTLPGIPLIYYGDEVGLAGGGDPDNRRSMVWSGYNSGQSALKAHLTKLTKIRSTYAALRMGKRQQKWMDSSVYVYTMSYAGDEVVVLLNRSDAAKTVTPALSKTSYTDLLTNKAVSASSISIGARSSMILH